MLTTQETAGIRLSHGNINWIDVCKKKIQRSIRFTQTSLNILVVCPHLYVLLQLVYRHGEVRVVVVVEGNVTTGLVHHGEERAQAAQAREVHDMLHLGGMFKRLDHKPSRSEVGLQNGCYIPLDLNCHRKRTIHMMSKDLSGRAWPS